MKALKVLGVIAVFVLLARYFPILYYSMEFNDFVKQEVQRSRIAPQLEKALLDQAQIYFLPVKAEDIRIFEDGKPQDVFTFQQNTDLHCRSRSSSIVVRQRSVRFLKKSRPRASFWRPCFDPTKMRPPSLPSQVK